MLILPWPRQARVDVPAENAYPPGRTFGFGGEPAYNDVSAGERPYGGRV